MIWRALKDSVFTIFSAFSLRLLRSRVLWKLPKFTSLEAPEQTKDYNYGRRGASMAASVSTANRHCLCGPLFSPNVMFFRDLEGNLYSAFPSREVEYISVIGVIRDMKW